MLAQKICYKMSFTYPCPRKLREIMKMSMIEREPTHVVKSIWEDYHEPRAANIATVIDKEMYEHIKNKYTVSKVDQ
jgi:ATP synthase mitochondrial F1 complex assembly factor 1